MSKISSPNSQNSKLSSKPFKVPLTLPGSFSSTKRMTPNSDIFYSLTDIEQRAIKFDGRAMKPVSSEILTELKTDRNAYLEKRYSSQPAARYNYPVATSFRYGWFNL